MSVCCADRNRSQQQLSCLEWSSSLQLCSQQHSVEIDITSAYCPPPAGSRRPCLATLFEQQQGQLVFCLHSTLSAWCCSCHIRTEHADVISPVFYSVEQTQLTAWCSYMFLYHRCVMTIVLAYSEEILKTMTQ